MKKILIKTVVMIGLTTMMYLGFFEQIEGARYVVKFFVWAICLPVGFLALSDTLQKTMAEDPPSNQVAIFFSRLVSWSVLATFVWFGHIATGFAWGAYMLCAAINKHAVDTIRSKATKPKVAA